MAFARLALSLSLAGPRASEAFSCLDDKGQSVDYFAAIKGNSGSDVYYHDTSSSGHFTSAADMSSTSSAVVRTVNQLYGSLGSSYAYAMYNDQPPNAPGSNTRAHSKGVILFDGSQGFWLVHSFPKWPNAQADGYGGMPSTVFAQSFLCMTFRTSALEDIAEIQLVQWPDIYSSAVSSSLNSSLPSFVSWIHGSKSSDTRITKTLHTYNGRSLTHYGKSDKCDCDLYDSIVAPGLNGDLYVESWQNGAGSLVMPSYCKSEGYKHNIYNINQLQFNDGRNISQTSDHSKWVVTDSASRSACIGDINRQSSQRSRGGGTVCYDNADLWKAFNELIVSYEECSSYQNSTELDVFSNAMSAVIV